MVSSGSEEANPSSADTKSSPRPSPGAIQTCAAAWKPWSGLCRGGGLQRPGRTGGWGPARGARWQAADTRWQHARCLASYDAPLLLRSPHTAGWRRPSAARQMPPRKRGSASPAQTRLRPRPPAAPAPPLLLPPPPALAAAAAVGPALGKADAAAASRSAPAARHPRSAAAPRRCGLASTPAPPWCRAWRRLSESARPWRRLPHKKTPPRHATEGWVAGSGPL